MEKFEQDWNMKPVEIKGIFDDSREMRVVKMKNGEKGFDIVTPFETHLDKSGKVQSILVNRGWIPHDLRDQRMHYNTDALGTIRGLLYRGDADTKYSKRNNPTIKEYYTARPQELTLIAQCNNRDEAGQMMLHMVDFDEERRQILPTIPTSNELTKWVVSADRHASYEAMWRIMAFSGVLANTALWIYF